MATKFKVPSEHNGPHRRVSSPAPRSATTKSSRITLSIDNDVTECFLATSSVVPLRTWETTELGLYEEMIRLYPDFSIADIFHEGAKSFARRKIAEANSDALAAAQKRPGSADKRLAHAYAAMLKDNEKAKAAGERQRKITAYTLAEEASSSWRSADDWLKGPKRMKLKVGRTQTKTPRTR